MHLWLFTPGESSLERWLSEKVELFGVQVDGSCCSQQSSREVLIFKVFPPTPVL